MTVMRILLTRVILRKVGTKPAQYVSQDVSGWFLTNRVGQATLFGEHETASIIETCTQLFGVLEVTTIKEEGE